MDNIVELRPNKHRKYPRLQSNARGDIIMVLGKNKDETLTQGIKVGNTNNSISSLPLGLHITDWEVCGQLHDYDGEVDITLRSYNA